MSPISHLLDWVAFTIDLARYSLKMTVEILANQHAVILDSDEVTLGARAFDFLIFLHKHADRVVLKEELLVEHGS
jgi:DNA-binding winged helix-turn-helix (wHTH) protein